MYINMHHIHEMLRPGNIAGINPCVKDAKWHKQRDPPNQDGCPSRAVGGSDTVQSAYSPSVLHFITAFLPWHWHQLQAGWQPQATWGEGGQRREGGGGEWVAPPVAGHRRQGSWACLPPCRPWSCLVQLSTTRRTGDARTSKHSLSLLFLILFVFKMFCFLMFSFIWGSKFYSSEFIVLLHSFVERKKC